MRCGKYLRRILRKQAGDGFRPELLPVWGMRCIPSATPARLS